MTLIYLASPPAATAAGRELQRRANILIHQLDEQKATLLLPSVVVAEYLCGIEPEKHGAVLAELQQRFLTPPFDVRASAMAAQLWLRHRELPKAEQAERTVLKADVLIIASAKLAGAVRFYSHDATCRKIAAQIMDASDLPTHSENLFVEAESGRVHDRAPAPKPRTRKPSP